MLKSSGIQRYCVDFGWCIMVGEGLAGNYHWSVIEKIRQNWATVFEVWELP